MSTKLPAAAAGLALALILAVFGTGATGAESSPLGTLATADVQATDVEALGADEGPAPTIQLDADEAPTTTATTAPTTEAPAPTTTVAPTTTTTTTAAPPATGGSMEDIVRRHFGAAAPAAFRIISCESGWNPNAVSRTNDHGLFQINAVHAGTFTQVTGAPWSQIYDPELNTIYAKYLYDQSGWGPWSCAH